MAWSGQALAALVGARHLRGGAPLPGMQCIVQKPCRSAPPRLKAGKRGGEQSMAQHAAPPCKGAVTAIPKERPRAIVGPARCAIGERRPCCWPWPCCWGWPRGRTCSCCRGAERRRRGRMRSGQGVAFRVRAEAPPPLVPLAPDRRRAPPRLSPLQAVAAHHLHPWARRVRGRLHVRHGAGLGRPRGRVRSGRCQRPRPPPVLRRLPAAGRGRLRRRSRRSNPQSPAAPASCARRAAFSIQRLFQASDASAAPKQGCTGGGGLKREDLDAAELDQTQLECAFYNATGAARLGGVRTAGSSSRGQRQRAGGEARPYRRLDSPCTAAPSEAAAAAAPAAVQPA